MSYSSYSSYTLFVEEIAKKVSEHYGLPCKDVTEFLLKEMEESGKEEKEEKNATSTSSSTMSKKK